MRSSVRTPLLAALACAAGLVAVLAAAYSGGVLGRLDVFALKGFESLSGPVSGPLTDRIAHSADPLPLGIMLAVVMGGGWLAGRHRQVVVAAAAVLGANATTALLKIVLAHPRVHPALGTEIGADAFPSGHATGAMSIALAAVMVAPPRLRFGVALGGGAFALAVASSLLMHGWHFPSDVAGGLLVASGCAFAAIAASRALARRSAGSPTPLRLALPRLGRREAGLGAAAAVLLVLPSLDGAADFLRAHTAASVAAVGLVAACAALLTAATVISDR